MRTISLRFLLSLILSSSILAQPALVGRKAILGFSETGAAGQTAIEARFDSILKASNMLAWLKRLSARPHHLGSAYNKENADFIASQFRSWGYDTKLEEFQVLFPTPKTRVVEMTAPEKFKLKLQETELK